MFRRALTFIKQICSRRGYILYLPSFSLSEAFSPEYMSSLLHNQRDLNTNSFLELNIFTRENSNVKLQNLESNISSTNSKHIKVDNLSRVVSSNNTNFLPSNLLNIRTNFSSHSLRELLFFLRQKREERFFIPEALFITNINQNHTLIREALKLQVPIIAILDSNSNPFGIQYPIPGNSESIEALLLYIQLLFNTILSAKKHEIKTFLAL
jgi:hypothetical protein